MSSLQPSSKDPVPPSYPRFSPKSRPRIEPNAARIPLVKNNIRPQPIQPHSNIIPHLIPLLRSPSLETPNVFPNDHPGHTIFTTTLSNASRASNAPNHPSPGGAFKRLPILQHNTADAAPWIDCRRPSARTFDAHVPVRGPAVLFYPPRALRTDSCRSGA